MEKLIALLTFFWGASAGLQAQQTWIYCGQLVDTELRSVREGVTVIVEGNRIAEVREGYARVPKGMRLIDLRNHTVLPGLMDMHVHIEHESNPKAYEERFRKNEADVAFDAAVYARRTLLAGFTTVRDLGGSGVNVALRKAIDAGKVVGPRIFTAEKSLASTGGHADPTNGVKRSMMGDPGPKEGVVNGAADARKAVRQRYKNGADLIKITATGGVLSVAKDGQGPQFTMEELEAIIHTAHDYGMHVAAHAHGKEGMRRAILAGVTSIEHGTLMDDEIIELMKEHGTWYVPTISAGRFVAEKAKVPGYFPAPVVPKALAIGPQIQETFAKAYRAGVKIAFGTDSGVSPHGQNAQEFAYMVEAGMPPIEAIASATMHAAELLGLTDRLGSVRAGKLADIIAVKGNPLQDIRLLQQVDFVMKDGIVYKMDGKEVVPQ